MRIRPQIHGDNAVVGLFPADAAPDLAVRIHAQLPLTSVGFLRTYQNAGLWSKWRKSYILFGFCHFHRPVFLPLSFLLLGNSSSLGFFECLILPTSKSFAWVSAS